MKKKNNFYTWLDQIANKKAQEWMQAPVEPLFTDEVYTEMLNNPTYTPSMAQLANYWNYLDRAEDHPVKINLPEYDKANKETDDKTLDQKAQEEREYQAKHPFLSNVSKNLKEVARGWDNFWKNNLYRYPAAVAASGILGKGVQALGRMKKAADLIKLRKDTAHLGPGRYRDAAREVGPDIHDKLINDALDAYGEFQQTPIGALLPFDDGKDANSMKINLPEYGGGKIGSFVHRMGPLIYQGLAARGVKNIGTAYANLMRQIGHESGYGTSGISKQHNYGGIKIPGSNNYRKFDSDRAFADYYLNVMTDRYRNAIDARDLAGFVNALGAKGYFRGQTAAQYLGKLSTLKSLDRAVAQDLAARRNFYNQTTGVQPNPETGSAEFVQPVPVEQQRTTIPYLDPQKLGTFTVPVTTPNFNTQLQLPKLMPEQYPVIDDNASFDHGKSGIHINPANRGKFNATKKRTGKTTEELSHSKNPLTRKRAQFALNARKWKH